MTNYYHVYSYKKYLANDVFFLVFSATITVTTVFLNSFTVLVYWKSPQLKKTLSYFLIMILSCIDLAVGVFCNTQFTAFVVTRITGNGNCQIFSLMVKGATVLSGMSMAALTTMSFERYLGILHPITHRTKLTKKRLSMFGVLAWCPWIVAFCTSFVNRDFLRVALLASTLFFWVSVVLTYVRIFLHGKRSLREFSFRIRAETTVATTLSQNSQLKKQQVRVLKDKKLARSCVTIIMCHFMCQIPLFITMGLLLGRVAIDYMIFLRGWTFVFSFLNSSLNSVLFFWVNARLKSEAVRIVRNAFISIAEKYRTFIELSFSK